ncbi:MAG TPA: orotate phosphoribosyltransferase [Candidatus Dormibacteraeota bacterium]|nr:orotate phosphoribosyltransferase [Candidatus Dormibacteraeota bacterium]
MSELQLHDELERRGALLTGHFRLSSGRHSGRFIQKFRMLEDPTAVEPVARALARRLRAYEPEIVVSAAVGGIILGYEVGRALGTLAIFVEKEHGVPVLRRGFALRPGQRAVVVEDVVTTGLSVRETVDVVERAGGRVVAVGAIVRRGEVTFDRPTEVLLDLPIEDYAPEECPLCARGEPLQEPGSRFSSTPS